MIGFLIALAASLPLIFSSQESREIEKNRMPCYPDTVEVIEQQIVQQDSLVMPNAPPIVRYKIVICNPTIGSLK